MSHAAMNWALKQRGFKPGVWKVLVHLADRHNPDLGYCYPDQDMLAGECEVSRATLNRYLLELEEAGLVRRVPQKDPVSRLQLNTRYYIAFDTDLDTLDVGSRVSNCDTENRVSKSSKSVSHSSETLITSKITSKNPLTPSGDDGPPPQDVALGRSVNAVIEDALYVECCAVAKRNPSLTDKSGGWYFKQAVIDEAERRLAGRLA